MYESMYGSMYESMYASMYESMYASMYESMYATTLWQSVKAVVTIMLHLVWFSSPAAECHAKIGQKL